MSDYNELVQKISGIIIDDVLEEKTAMENMQELVAKAKAGDEEAIKKLKEMQAKKEAPAAAAEGEKAASLNDTFEKIASRNDMDFETAVNLFDKLAAVSEEAAAIKEAAEEYYLEAQASEDAVNQIIEDLGVTQDELDVLTDV